MPPRQYTLVHPDASLSDEELATLVAALEAIDAGGGERSGRGRGSGGSDDGD